MCPGIPPVTEGESGGCAGGLDRLPETFLVRDHHCCPPGQGQSIPAAAVVTRLVFSCRMIPGMRKSEAAVVLVGPQDNTTYNLRYFALPPLPVPCSGGRPDVSGSHEGSLYSWDNEPVLTAGRAGFSERMTGFTGVGGPSETFGRIPP